MTTPIWNVIGVINGTIPDEVIIVGNHRDAWIVGGASDPNSGSAVLNEAIRSFGEAVKKGWKPLRTIVFASWDGEEYGLIGSTEWVEEYLPWLNKANVAYINVDVGVNGQYFSASAAPLLNNVIYEITSQIQSPNQTVKGQTVADLWDGHISTMGSGSDFTAFQDYAGIPCMDVRFQGGPGGAVYHYHSNYDSFYWMDKFGDPGFIYHRTMTQVLNFLTAKLADTLVIPLGAKDYADALNTYVKKVETALAASSAADTIDPSQLSEEEIFSIRARTGPVDAAKARRFPSKKGSFDRLYNATFSLAGKASALDHLAQQLTNKAAEEIPWWRWPSKLKLGYDIRQVNTKYKYIERKFLYQDGLDSRPWFKHIVFAPGLWTGYAGGKFW
jgi:N-acetylated-alpha-linked acidic dipeptidase